MFGLGNKNRLHAEEIEKLIVALKRVEKPTISSQHALSMKSRLMAKIRENRRFDPLPAPYRKFSAGLKTIAAKIMLPARMAAILKERVMAAVEERANLINVTPYNRHFRFATAGVMLLVFVVTSFFAAPFRVPVTYAGTYLQDISGDVLVWRGGMYMDARKDLALNEGDLVVTLKDSSVTIHFLDRSIGRLSGNTGVEIKKLYSDPQNPVFTKVELYLREGKILAKVGNLIDENSEFTVGTDKAVADVPKKGAFDMSEAADSTRIAVFDNMVDVKPASDDGNQYVKTVLAGYSAEIKKDDVSDIAVKQIEKTDPEVVASTQWLENNNIKEVANSNATLAETATADVSNTDEQTVTATQEDTDVIANADVEAQKTYFSGKLVDLVEAEAMFVRGNHKEGSRLLRSFRRGVSNILAAMPVLEAKDPVGSSILKKMMKEKVAGQMKDLSAFLPGDSLYPVKEQMQDVELLLADNRVEQINLKISQAENKLLEIQELLQGDKISYAAALLNDYKDRMDQLVLTVSQADNPDLEGILLDLVTQQVQQIKVMTSIEGTLAGTSNTDFLNQVTALRRETMMKLLGSLESIKDNIPQEVMLGLKDVFDTYLVDASDRDIFAPEFERLFGETVGLNFIQPEGDSIPDSVGMVVLVNMEATPDATQADVNIGQAAALPAGQASSSDALDGQQP